VQLHAKCSVPKPGAVRSATSSLRLDHSITGYAEAPTFDDYRLWLACKCGAGWERWVTPDMALDDLLHSSLLALPN
jgi:hypothetical protein